MLLVHTDGTILTTVNNQAGPGAPVSLALIGIDPTTGTEKFSAPIPTVSWLGAMIIAGDGYVYVPYATCDAPCSDYGPASKSLMLLRVDSSGASSNIDVYDWTDAPDAWDNAADQNCACEFHIITNADTGTLITWRINGIPGMAITTGTSVSQVSPAQIPGQVYPTVPVLQAQDGSFVGAVTAGGNGLQSDMVAFDASGTVRWVAPNMCPQIATADGGVIAQAPNADSGCESPLSGPGYTFDANGNATGMAAIGTQSWQGNQYQVGPVDQVFSTVLKYCRYLRGFSRRQSVKIRYKRSTVQCAPVGADCALES
jgi:hypothetical protein